MQDKTRFAESLRDYVCQELLTDRLIDLAFHAELEPEAVFETLHPLLVRDTPLHALTLLHAALADPRLTLAVMHATLDALRALRDWRDDTLRDTVLRAAAEHAVAPRDAHAICTGWMLFGPSTLELYPSMAALGREAVCRRGETAARALRAGMLVS